MSSVSFLRPVSSALRGYREYLNPPQGWSLEILMGRGVSKAKIVKEKYEAKLEIPEWGGRERSQHKNHPWGRHGYFL